MPRAAGLVLVALVAALIVPTSVLASPAQRYTSESTQFFCGELQSEAGSAYVTAWLSADETFADVGFWAAPAQPGESPVTWAGWSNNTRVSDDGSAVEGTFDVYGFAEGDVDDPSDLIFIGEATLAATLTPSGDPDTWRFRDRLGNHQSTARGTAQVFAVSGTLSLPNDISFDLSSCEALRSTETWFGNAPAKSVAHTTDSRLSCSWETGRGYVALFANDGEFGSAADLFVRTTDGFIYAPGVASLSRTAFDATFELIPEWDEEGVPIGSASASAVLTVQDRIRQSEISPEGRITLKGVQLGVDGSLTLDVEGQTTTLPMDATSCQAADVRYAQLPGRQSRVEPVANDTPEAAIPLKLFDKLMVSTAGTDDAPEAPCLLDDGEGGTFEGPMTNTVWWRIEATGGSITVDTSGSLFDTMVAVYLVEDGAVGAQIACVDDVDESLQALVTFETAGDVSYLVQTGGFGGETGDLALAIYEP